MQDTLYAAPAAPLAEVRPVEAARVTPFFVVAPRKFVLMYLGTLGLYRYYWSYRHWTHVHRATGTPMWPVARSLFAIFFMHELNVEADHRARQQAPVHWDPGTSTTLYVAVSMASFVLGRAANADMGPAWLALVPVALLVPLAYSLSRTQCVANIASGDPDGRANARLTWANAIWLAVGTLWWLLLAVGTAAIVLGLAD